jgi:galacturonosyltransferase
MKEDVQSLIRVRSRCKKVLLLGNSNLVIFKFRKELVQRLISENYEVFVSFPNGPFGEGEKSAKEFGCTFFETKIDRRGKNIFRDLGILSQYIKMMRKIQPDVVLAYTVKPDIYGGIACRMLEIPFIPNITGLGKGIAEGGITERITKVLYKVSVKKAINVYFQNNFDKQYFDREKIKYYNAEILPGSGVNLSEFIACEYPDPSEPIRFLYVARVMKAKGIEEFFTAAVYIKKKYSNTEFHICGYCEEDYNNKIEQYQKEGIVTYHGLVDNVMDYEKICHCVVLPTFHPEGVSNVLLEAAACARPVITTDRPGCRETVDDRVSGYLIRERDSQDLIDKMEQFIKLPHSEKVKMGKCGRIKVKNNFNRDFVVDSYLNTINNYVAG